MQSLETIFSNIQTKLASSQEMKNYINSLSKEEYAHLATAYIIGRSGWERNYYDTNEYYSFVENNESSGIKVTQQMLDDKFLTNNIKKEQIQLTYDYELSSSDKFNGIYNHDWLGMKTNLITEVQKGLNMLGEIS